MLLYVVSYTNLSKSLILLIKTTQPHYSCPEAEGGRPQKYRKCIKKHQLMGVYLPMQLFIELLEESSCLCSAGLSEGLLELRGSGLSSVADGVFKWRGSGGGGGGGGKGGGGGGGGGEHRETIDSSLCFCSSVSASVTKIWTGMSAGVFSREAFGSLSSTSRMLCGCSRAALALHEGAGDRTAGAVPVLGAGAGDSTTGC